MGCSLRKISSEYPAHNFVFTDMPESDITDEGCMEELAERHKADVIVNCAAYTAVDRAESEPGLARRINAYGAQVLAGVAARRSIALVHISTDYVFDGEGCRPLREDAATGPTGVYGLTKLEGEEAIRRAGCRAAVVRTSWLCSEFGNNFVKTMLRVGRERGELSVVYDQVGTPTFADDLSRAVIVLAQRGVEGFEVYHFSSEGAVSWYDFAKAIFDMSAMNVRVNPIVSSLYPTAARRPSYSVLAKDKIKEAGAVVPYWRDSLARCLAVLKNE